MQGGDGSFVQLLFDEAVYLGWLKAAEITRLEFFQAANDVVHDAKVKNAMATLRFRVRPREGPPRLSGPKGGSSTATDWARLTIRNLDGHDAPSETAGEFLNLDEPTGSDAGQWAEQAFRNAKDDDLRELLPEGFAQGMFDRHGRDGPGMRNICLQALKSEFERRQTTGVTG